MQSKEKDLVPYLGGIIVDLNSVVVTKMWSSLTNCSYF